MKYQASCVIAPDHPSLAGHFPGNPIVPGVVILDEVYSVLIAWQGHCHINAFSSVKFLQPILPGQSFIIHLKETAPRQVQFECKMDDSIAVAGKLSYLV